MARWPKDNQSALIKFYGDPGSGAVADQLTKITPPFKMYYDGKYLKTLSVHEKCADAMLAALTKVWDYYGHDQAAIDKLGISKTAGIYYPRKVRGSKTKWSNHAYGAAIDINAAENGFNVVGNIPIPMIAAFKSEGARWGGDYKGRKDPMHFEFCDGGEKSRSFDEWLDVLGKSAPKAPADENHYKGKKRPSPPPVKSSAADEVTSVQTLLKQIGYHEVGEIDGIFGSRTTAAIAAFKKDWNQPGIPTIDAQLKTVLAKAVAEFWKRPIDPDRKAATSAELAPKLPEVGAALVAQRAGWWAAITTGASALVTGVAKTMGEAVELLNPLKTFIADLPWPVWVTGALGVSVALYFISRKSGDAANAATQAYQEGARV